MCDIEHTNILMISGPSYHCKKIHYGVCLETHMISGPYEL